MKKITLALILIVTFGFSYQALSQKVAVVGANHVTPDGISCVVTEAISNGDVIYFTDNEYNNATNAFNSGEAVVSFTASTNIAVGDVIFIKEVSTNTFTVSCTSGVCGSAVTVVTPFALGSSGETIYAYSDTDSDPTNGITEIFSAFHTISGSIAAGEDPSVDFASAIVVDGFGSVAPDRTEFNASRDMVSKAELENPANYTNGSANADLNTSAFTNLDISGTNPNPVVTLTSSPASVAENSGSSITYTFARTGSTASPLTVNFNVGGSATLTTDYTQSGALTFLAISGTVTIGAGNNSAAITITPVGDTDLEPNETVVLTVASGTGYDAGFPGMAGGTINNDDTMNITPMVAVVGTNHTGTDGFSFVALDDISGGTTTYFTENPFDMGTLSFSGSEAVLAWTAPGSGVSRGEVIVVSETGTNIFTTTCNSGTCGTTNIVSGNFSLASDGEGFFAYQDTDNDHTNGVTQVDAVLYTGAPGNPGGNIPMAQNPGTKYIGAVVVDGFPSSMPSLTEYDPTKRGVPVDQTNFTNTGNWNHAQASGTLSTVPFTDITITTGPTTPIITISSIRSTVVEGSGQALLYTFDLNIPAPSILTVNFEVGGTATLGSDYSTQGFTTFTSTGGTETIPMGNTSVDMLVIPVNDSDVEPTETVILTLASGTGYTAGSPNSLIGSITNDDTSASMPLVAITGLNHTTADGFSFVAAEDIPAGTIVYFTEDEFDNTNLMFSSGGEAVLQWTSPGATIDKGDVIVATETAPNTLTLTCSDTSGAGCGTMALITGFFSTATNGETFYAYADDDTDPTNGVTDIYAVLYTGNAGTSGGNIPAAEDPSGIFLNALVVDGFPATAPDRTEYDPTKRNVPVNMADFENIANWLHAQTNAVLSTVPFSMLNITPVDLELEKSVDNATPVVGASVTFTIALSNQGSATATGVEVTDLLPSGYTFTGFTASQGTYSSSTGIWDVGSLTAAQSETLTLSGTVNGTGDYLNLAEVTAQNEPDVDSMPGNGVDTDGDTMFIDDPDDEDDGDGEQVTPISAIDLELEKSVDNGTPNVGDPVTFTVEVSNQGTITATGVEVTDLLPSGYTFTGFTTSQGTYSSGTGIWALGTLNAAQMETLTVSATVNASGDYLNLAEVTAANETDSDSTPDNGVDTDGDTNFIDDPDDEDDGDGELVIPSSVVDLELEKSVDNATPNIGDPVTFTIEVTNQGPSTATGIEVTDLLPSGYTFTGFTTSQGAYNSGTGIWMLGTLNAAQMETLTVSGTVNASGDYLNLAEVTALNETDLDSSPNNGVDTDTDMDFIDDPGDEDDGDGEEASPPNILTITSFVLVDADTDLDIMTLSEGDVIDVTTLSTLNLSIRAETTADTESVFMQLSGALNSSRTENVPIYALFGNSGADYNGNIFPLGNFNISATPFSADNQGGMAGTPLSINFELLGPGMGSPLILVDSSTDIPIMDLTEGTVINKNVVGDLLFGVIFNPDLNPNGVKFTLSGPISESRTEGSSPPFSLFGDIGIDIQGMLFPTGNYTLVANPKNGPTVTVNFEVVDSDPLCDSFDASLASTTDPSACGGSDGSAMVSTTGFAPPLTYDWSHNMALNSDTATGLSAGDYTVTVTDDNGCTETLMFTLTDPGLPIVTFTAPADLAITAGVQAGLGGGTPTGGVYSGPGVTDDGNGMTYSFDPAAAGLGVHTLMYSFTDGSGCTNSATDNVEVFDLSVLSVTGFVLVNADANTDIVTLVEGAEIDQFTLPTLNLNIRANATADVESVRLELTGTASHGMTENFAPYALFGDISGNYEAGSLPVGSYSLTATPYSGNRLGGTEGTAMTINFTVIPGGGGGGALKLYPNPAVTEIQVKVVDSKKEAEVFTIQVHDMQGRLIKSYTSKDISGDDQFKMPTYSMQSGVYYMTVIGSQGTVQKKTFVVNK